MQYYVPAVLSVRLTGTLDERNRAGHFAYLCNNVLNQLNEEGYSVTGAYPSPVEDESWDARPLLYIVAVKCPHFQEARANDRVTTRANVYNPNDTGDASLWDWGGAFPEMPAISQYAGSDGRTHIARNVTAAIPVFGPHFTVMVQFTEVALPSTHYIWNSKDAALEPQAL